ncbi:Cof-type HAD-IIB family hydrolase [Lacticaseibacillus thailandensis]|uniref:HAD superfamily hydrolase n=1 Tax=Lacticaseibacillus thailandensis DSM 22698 = JCM 13996 TaxID=1423810 RepID=A0A0R2CF68_9LACO|nr:Cof-type HAD-IIB family hydrolase [Lacticaseibacillus thailandensis]KRM86812.1 HAD superfamily hydrolase [Lacticaseibacillus thailandensis DSM 22698 = JCM 13996]
MTAIKLVAVDMDGTFLNDAKDYDRAHFARIHHELDKQGIRFVVASGNQYYQLRSFFPDYPDTVYVAENGAYIRDDHTEYAVNSYSPAVAATILARLATIPDIHVEVSGARSAYALVDDDPDWIAQMRFYCPRMQLVPSFDELQDQLLKISVTCVPDQTQALVDRLRHLLAGLAVPTSSGHGDIDIIQPGVHKAAGLRRLGQVLGIDLAQMCAFGDGGNDVEMIAEVGLGVAMANATAPVQRVAAATISDDNNAQGVLTFLDGLLQ